MRGETRIRSWIMVIFPFESSPDERKAFQNEKVGVSSWLSGCLAKVEEMNQEENIHDKASNHLRDHWKQLWWIYSVLDYGREWRPPPSPTHSPGPSTPWTRSRWVWPCRNLASRRVSSSWVMAAWRWSYWWAPGAGGATWAGRARTTDI